MYEFLENNSIYVVLIIVMMIWAGLFGYLLRIDRSVSKIQRKQS